MAVQKIMPNAFFRLCGTSVVLVYAVIQLLQQACGVTVSLLRDFRVFIGCSIQVFCGLLILRK